MSSLFGAGATATGAIVSSAVAGVVLAGVAGVALTSVAENITADSDSSAKLSDINAPRYADQ
jgi:hypothetical protein